MEMCLMVVLKITKDFKEFINIEMGMSMKELGKMMSKKVLENCIFKTEKAMKEALYKGKNMGKEFIPGKTEINILETFNMIKDRDLVNIFGKMEEFIRANGAPIV
jgi:hypothetical protein